MPPRRTLKHNMTAAEAFACSRSPRLHVVLPCLCWRVQSASALAFLVSDTPVEMLGQFTKLALDGPESWQVRGKRKERQKVQIIHLACGR